MSPGDETIGRPFKAFRFSFSFFNTWDKSSSFDRTAKLVRMVTAAYIVDIN